jgi:hypothetical protein
MKLTDTGILRINFRDFLPNDNRRIRCNYHCSYCNQAHVPSVAFTETDYVQACRLWDSLQLIEDRLLVRANFDGEIFIDAWAQKICFYIAGLPNVKRFEFVTNNSVDPERYMKYLDPRKAVFNCSFHPEFTSVDRFIDHVRKIQSSGSRAIVTMVVKPQEVSRLDVIVARFKDEGIFFKPVLLLGRYQPGVPEAFRRVHKQICRLLGINIVFPQAYSAKALETIEKHYYSTMEFEYQYGKQTRGRLCWAGVDMINIFKDGTVMRCFDEKMGTADDLLAGKLRLPGNPYPCHSETCQCPAHMIFLDDFRAQCSLAEDFVDHYYS